MPKEYGLPDVFWKDGGSFRAYYFNPGSEKVVPAALEPLIGRKVVSVKEIFIDEYGEDPSSQQDTNGQCIEIGFGDGFYLTISSSGTMREPFAEFVEAVIGHHFSGLEIRTYETNCVGGEFDDGRSLVTNYFASFQMSDSAPFDFSIAGEHDQYYGVAPTIVVKRRLSDVEKEKEAREKFLAKVKPWNSFAKDLIHKGGSFFYWRKPGVASKLLGGTFSPPSADQLRYASKSDKKQGFGRAHQYAASELRFKEWRETPYGVYPVFSLAVFDPENLLTDNEEWFARSKDIDVVNDLFGHDHILSLYLP